MHDNREGFEKTHSERAAEAVVSLRELFFEAREEGYFTQLWDLVGAMRGPDSAGEAAQREKERTTKAIRRFCQIRSRLLGEDEDDPDQIEAMLASPSKGYKMWKEMAAFDVHHFTTHLLHAKTVCLEAMKHLGASEKGDEDSQAG